MSVRAWFTVTLRAFTVDIVAVAVEPLRRDVTVSVTLPLYAVSPTVRIPFANVTPSGSFAAVT